MMKTTNRILITCWLFVCCHLCIACTSATEPEDPPPDPEPSAHTDTLQVIDTWIAPGDTAAVDIFAANSVALGGYTFRLRYDPAILGIVTLPDNDSTVEHEQLRGNFLMRGAGLPEPGIVTFVAAFPEKQSGLLSGSGDLIRFWFYVYDSVASGVTTSIIFEDLPADSNAFNWFATLTGQSQYRPLTIPGIITVGESPTTQRPSYKIR